MSKPQNPIQMAVIGAAHGIKGEVRVKSYTGDPLALDDYGPLYAEDGRAFTILDIRMQKDIAVVRFKGVNDRSAAEALTGTALFVDRDMLPDDLEDEEFYHADLIGLDAVDLQNFGGGDILEIARGGKSTVLVPFTLAAVPVVDTKGRKVAVDPIAAGLVDTEDDPDAPRDDHAAVAKRPRGPKSAGGNR